MQTDIRFLLTGGYGIRPYGQRMMRAIHESPAFISAHCRKPAFGRFFLSVPFFQIAVVLAADIGLVMLAREKGDALP